MDGIGIAVWLIGTLLVVVTPMILLHELGHFIPAKLAGVRVEEFGIGYPPRMMKLWRDKGYLEIGGVRIVIPRNFRLPSGLIAGAWVDVVAGRGADGTYLLRHLRPLDAAGVEGGLTPQRAVREDGIELRGRLTAWEPGTLYSLNWLPLGGFTKMTGEEDPSDPRSLAAQPKRWRAAVLVGGAALNILTAFVVLTIAYSSGYPDAWLVKITEVDAGSAAEEYGLLPGDIVEAVEGERIVTGTVQLQERIHAAPERPITLTILRGNERLTIVAVPRRYDPPGEPSQGYGFLGIHISSVPDRARIRRHSLPAAFQAGCADIGATLMTLLRLPAMLARGEVTPQEARPVGIIGISSMLTFTLQRSIEWKLPFPVLHDAAFVSLVLGLSNLLPIPFLDGGRLLIVLIEAVRRRRMSPEREAAIHFAGLLILLGLMLLVIFQDIVNPVIPWTWLK